MIPLDKYDFSPDELPVFLCRSMAGIPFGFGISKNGEMLSLELAPFFDQPACVSVEL